LLILTLFLSTVELTLLCKILKINTADKFSLLDCKDIKILTSYYQFTVPIW
jgi:hypothetical protein